MSLITAYRYKYFGCNSVFEMVHNRYHRYPEVFIPSKKIIFNNVNVFYTEEGPRNVDQLRYCEQIEKKKEEEQTIQPLEEIQLTEEFVNKLVELANLELTLTQLKKELKPEIQQILKI